MNAAPPGIVIAGPVGLVRSWKSKVPVLKDRIKIPIRKPRSAKRVTIKA
jgi:hypothetical protein